MSNDHYIERLLRDNRELTEQVTRIQADSTAQLTLDRVRRALDLPGGADVLSAVKLLKAMYEASQAPQRSDDHRYDGTDPGMLAPRMPAGHP